MSTDQQRSTIYAVDLAFATDRTQVGGKALHLQRALSIGIQVPTGFVIPRCALTHVLAENALATQVSTYLTQSVALSGEKLRYQYETICAAILTAPVPAAIAQPVTSQVNELLATSPAGLVVRSSGIHEDSAIASFAGIYTSYLGITTHTALWEAIRRCWCATWSPGALAYARRMNINLQADGMALIVQLILAAESAGVIFTAEPLTGNPWRFVMNATFGLAQDLVSGTAPADRFVVAWDTREIVERQVAEKATMLHVTEQGVEASAVPSIKQNLPSLSEAQVSEVAQVALELDRAFDHRVDLEWVIVEGKVYVVQARPLTTLPTFFPHDLSEADASITWTPSDPVWYRTAKPGERLVAPFFRDRSALELWLRYSPGAFFPQQTGQERDFNGYRYQTAWHWEATSYSVEETIAWLQRHEADMQVRWLEQQAAMQGICQRATETLLAARRAADLIPSLLQVRAAESDFMAATWGAPQWMFFTCEWLLKELLKEIAPDFAIGRLMQGLPCLSQTHTEKAQQLGRAIVEPFVRTAFLKLPLDQVLPYLVQNYPDSRFLQDYELFCWQFGMCPPSWPVAWRGDDNQAQVLLVIKKSMLGEGQDARTVLEAGVIERAKAEAEVRALIEQYDVTLLPRFEQLLTWAHFWTPQLDNRGWLAGYIYVRLLDLMRRTGEMLVREGILDDSTDLYLLTPEDLTQIANTASVTEQRQLYQQCRHNYERNRRLNPPVLLGRPLEQLEETQPIRQAMDSAQVTTTTLANVPGRLLKGDGLAPGRITGIARKTKDLSDAAFLDSLTKEDILIYPGYSTWPDWLSLFMVVKGIVTVQGVQLHHAAQIARECGVPYINLPEHAWDSIPDNVPLALDGVQGTVMVLA
jgi:phosphohistidine swiveling domain-containing protein